MPLDLRDTTVTFPAGEVTGSATVLAIRPDTEVDGLPAGTSAIVVDRTPFHPVDHTWPDQPADQGTAAGIELSDCVVGAVSSTGEWYAGEAVPARRGDTDWRWLVLHVVPAAAAGVTVGDTIELAVDAELRSRYSRGHSACHLAALAMNHAAAGYWDKDPGRHDSLGNPDLDSLAIVRSRIEPDGAIDDYRLGRSIRRKGLRSNDLLADLPALAATVTATIQSWTAGGGPATILIDGDERLTARRRWTADLPVGQVAIPCGGTHVRDIGELSTTTVTYEPIEGGFRAHTHVPPPAAAGE